MHIENKTKIVTKEELDPKIYKCLCIDIARIRRISYDKDYKGKVAGMTVRCRVKYWLTQLEADGEITVEQYSRMEEIYK